jgi:purine-binding chemotaxis protein CheW
MASARQAFEVLLFAVGDQRYALDSAVVQTIARAVSITPLPRAPAIIEGIIDVRGTIVPVLDIRRRFRLAPKSVDLHDHLIVAWADRRIVAIRVDEVLDLHQLAAHEIEDRARILLDTAYVAGVARLGGGLVLIHDLSSFLSQAEATTLDEAIDAIPASQSR